MDLIYKGTKDYCICIDSDGTVFDNMELKHKECFCPAFINAFELQGIARAAREVWEYVNLYSRTRGFNRFFCMAESLRLLSTRNDVMQSGFTPENSEPLFETVKDGISNSASLREYTKTHPDESVLKMALACSDEIDVNVLRIVRGVRPFGNAVNAIKKASASCDIIIVSDSPRANIVREWTENGIIDLTDYITGQEYGGKKRCILSVIEQNSYKENHILMIGDAPRDREAAADSGVLFFPINPASENNSWAELCETGLDKFLSGAYSGGYEDSLAQGFMSALSSKPTWEGV